MLQLRVNDVMKGRIKRGYAYRYYPTRPLSVLELVWYCCIIAL